MHWRKLKGFTKLAFVCCACGVQYCLIHVFVSCCSQAVNGQAIDRHLLGMKLAAIESRMNLHELFMDSSYQYALHYKLSTSQVPWTGRAEDYKFKRNYTTNNKKLKKVERKVVR